MEEAPNERVKTPSTTCEMTTNLLPMKETPTTLSPSGSSLGELYSNHSGSNNLGKVRKSSFWIFYLGSKYKVFFALLWFVSISALFVGCDYVTEELIPMNVPENIERLPIERESQWRRHVATKRRTRKFRLMESLGKQKREQTRNNPKILTDTEGVQAFKRVDAMRHIPDNALIKKELSEDKFLLREEDVLYKSKYAEAYAAGNNTYMKRGIIWGVVSSSKVGGQGKGAVDDLETFRRYINEICKSAQSARMFQSKEAEDRIGFALVMDQSMEDLLPEQIELFDYIIYNRLPEQAQDHFKNGLGWCGKVSTLLFTPFEESLYVDGDTQFCSNTEPEFDALRHSSIAMAAEHRIAKDKQNSLDLAFNAGVIVYRKNVLVATLIHDVIQTIIREWRGDQEIWADKLREFRRYGNLRVSILSPRYHMQPCRGTFEACIVSGEIILLHGRCWLEGADKLTLAESKIRTTQFCAHINYYTDSRFIAADCKPPPLNVFKLDYGDRRGTANLVKLNPPPVKDEVDGV